MRRLLSLALILTLLSGFLQPISADQRSTTSVLCAHFSAVEALTPALLQRFQTSFQRNVSAKILQGINAWRRVRLARTMVKRALVEPPSTWRDIKHQVELENPDRAGILSLEETLQGDLAQALALPITEHPLGLLAHAAVSILEKARQGMRAGKKDLELLDQAISHYNEILGDRYRLSLRLLFSFALSSSMDQGLFLTYIKSLKRFPKPYRYDIAGFQLLLHTLRPRPRQSTDLTAAEVLSEITLEGLRKSTLEPERMRWRTAVVLAWQHYESTELRRLIQANNPQALARHMAWVMRQEISASSPLIALSPSLGLLLFSLHSWAPLNEVLENAWNAKNRRFMKKAVRRHPADVSPDKMDQWHTYRPRLHELENIAGLRPTSFMPADFGFIQVNSPFWRKRTVEIFHELNERKLLPDKGVLQKAFFDLTDDFGSRSKNNQRKQFWRATVIGIVEYLDLLECLGNPTHPGLTLEGFSQENGVRSYHVQFTGSLRLPNYAVIDVNKTQPSIRITCGIQTDDSRELLTQCVITEKSLILYGFKPRTHRLYPIYENLFPVGDSASPEIVENRSLAQVLPYWVTLLERLPQFDTIDQSALPLQKYAGKSDDHTALQTFLETRLQNSASRLIVRHLVINPVGLHTLLLKIIEGTHVKLRSDSSKHAFRRWHSIVALFDLWELMARGGASDAYLLDIPNTAQFATPLYRLRFTSSFNDAIETNFFYEPRSDGPPLLFIDIARRPPGGNAYLKLGSYRLGADVGKRTPVPWERFIHVDATMESNEEAWIRHFPCSAIFSADFNEAYPYTKTILVFRRAVEAMLETLQKFPLRREERTDDAPAPRIKTAQVTHKPGVIPDEIRDKPEAKSMEALVQRFGITDRSPETPRPSASAKTSKPLTPHRFVLNALKQIRNAMPMGEIPNGEELLSQIPLNAETRTIFKIDLPQHPLTALTTLALYMLQESKDDSHVPFGPAVYQELDRTITEYNDDRVLFSVLTPPLSAPVLFSEAAAVADAPNLVHLQGDYGLNAVIFYLYTKTLQGIGDVQTTIQLTHFLLGKMIAMEVGAGDWFPRAERVIATIVWKWISQEEIQTMFLNHHPERWLELAHDVEAIPGLSGLEGLRLATTLSSWALSSDIANLNRSADAVVLNPTHADFETDMALLLREPIHAPTLQIMPHLVLNQA